MSQHSADFVPLPWPGTIGIWAGGLVLNRGLMLLGMADGANWGTVVGMVATAGMTAALRYWQYTSTPPAPVSEVERLRHSLQDSQTAVVDALARLDHAREISRQLEERVKQLQEDLRRAKVRYDDHDDIEET